MSYRFAIIGQSNAILNHGFSNQLGSRKSVTVGNMARLGASPSVILPYFATVEFFRDHDYAIFDTAIVDQNFLWSRSVDLYAISRWIEYGVVAAQAVGCTPIILTLPHSATLTLADAVSSLPPLNQLYRSIAMRHGVACFDIYETAASRILEKPNAIDVMYDDPNHLSEAFTSEVVDSIINYVDIHSKAEFETRSIKKALQHFDKVPLASAPRARPRRLSSSLLSDQFVEMWQGESLTLNIGEVVRIDAILIDRAQSKGMLLLKGSTEVKKHLGTNPDSKNDFVAQLVPIIGELQDGNGRVTITAIPPQEVETEPSWQKRAAKTSRLRMAQILCERQPATVIVDQPVLPRHLRETDWFRIPKQ